VVHGDALAGDAVIAIFKASCGNGVCDERHSITRAAARRSQTGVVYVHTIGDEAYGACEGGGQQASVSWISV
jgi:hypothetical protein